MNDHPTTAATNVEEHIEDAAKSSVALGAGMMLVGLLLGFIWAWLRFFRRGKSPRGGIVGNSGQVGRTCLVAIYFEFGFIYRKPSMLRFVRSFLYLIYALL